MVTTGKNSRLEAKRNGNVTTIVVAGVPQSTQRLDGALWTFPPVFMPVRGNPWPMVLRKVLLRPCVWTGLVAVLAYWDKAALNGVFVYDDAGM
jgi:hypothetical protein